ncbi:MAG: DUF115 domain-containing protein [Nitrospinae bacterium]|nr:DUF115 domain-containing protein [Nitrospinota bacterium]
MVDQERLKEVKNATIQLFTPLWQSNFNKNKRDIARCPGVNTLKDKFKNIPCVIVGAGPSLDKNIKYLHAAKDRTLIISCDAALKTLLSNSITPSLVVNLDPQEYVVDFFKGLDTRGLTLVASTVIHPSVLKMWFGRIIFYNKYAPDIPLFKQIQAVANEVGTLTPGGSVLSVAYDLSFKIGANPITFIGQDLSYSSGNVYTREIIHKEENLSSIYEKQKENIVSEMDIFGSNIPTIKSMSVTKQWLEWAFSQWKRDGALDVINSTEGGILKKGCQIMPLSEVIYRYCNKKINAIWMLNKILKYKV